MPKKKNMASEKNNEFYYKFIEDSPFIEERTKRTYVNILKRVVAVFEIELHDIVYNPDKYGPLIVDGKRFESENTQKTIFTALLAMFNYSAIKQKNKELYNKWYVYFVDVKKSLMNKAITHQPTKRQVNAHVHWEDIVKSKDQFDYGSDYHLLMSMYTMIPPRRQWDYCWVKLYTSKQTQSIKMDHNHISLHGDNGPYMLLTDYKTAKIMKNYYKVLPKELVKVIKTSLQKQPREYLFMKTNSNGSLDKYPRTESFTRWSNYVIKKALNNQQASLNTLRHSYDTYMQDKYPNMDVKQRMEMSRDMGHSVMQSLLYRLKIGPEDLDKPQVEDCLVVDENDKSKTKKGKCIVLSDKDLDSTKTLNKYGKDFLLTKIKLKGKYAKLLAKK
jgi:integrase